MVHDGVEPTWHSLLDTESYSLRVAQADMPRVPEILKAVPQADIDRMRANLAKVWRRCAASGAAAVAAVADAAGMHDGATLRCLDRLPRRLRRLPAAPRAPHTHPWCRHVWTGYRPYGELVRGFLQGRKEQAAAEGRDGAQAAPGALPLDPDAYDPGQDDALATLMQAGAGGGGRGPGPCSHIGSTWGGGAARHCWQACAAVSANLPVCPLMPFTRVFNPPCPRSTSTPGWMTWGHTRRRRPGGAACGGIADRRLHPRPRSSSSLLSIVSSLSALPIQRCDN